MRAFCVILLFCVTIDSIFAVCTKLPPGIERVIRGIDITQLDLVPTDMMISNGFLHPLIEFTCTTGRKWRNPVEPTIEYDIPDQIETINSLPGGIVDFKSKTYASHSDVKNGMSSSVGIDFAAGMFSASGSYMKKQQSIIDNLNNIISISAYVSAYELELKPYLQQKLGASVMLFFNQLPATYQENPGLYQEFLSTFGTNFFNSGIFGGYLSTTFEFMADFKNVMKERQIEAEAGATFLNLIKLHGGYAGVTAAVSDAFKKAAHYHEAYYGGIANLMTEPIPNYAQWWKSVPSNPWLFGGQLVPITRLLPAGPKRDALGIAINVKLDKAYLEDVSRSMEYLLKRYSGLPGLVKGLVNFHNQVIALRNQAIPNHSLVMSLSAPIENAITDVRNKAEQLRNAFRCKLFKNLCKP